MNKSYTTILKTAVCCIIQNFSLFIIGGMLYTLIELLFRGYSHISMFILGGIDFVIIGTMNEYSTQKNIFTQSLLGAMIITLSELITGYIVNIKLGLNVWDYSNLPLNFAGQICLYYSLLWIPVSFAAVLVDDLLRFWFFNEDIPSYFHTKKSAIDCSLSSPHLSSIEYKALKF